MQIKSVSSRLFKLFPVICLTLAGDVTAVSYEKLIPILTDRCIVCHSGEAAPLSLQLDSYDHIMQGSSNGSIIKKGDAAGSELIRRLKGVSQPRMPMTGPPYLSDDEIAMFEEWITDGAKQDGHQQEELPVIEHSDTPRSGVVTYLDVAPLFARRCAHCHTQGGLMGKAPEGYLLTSYAETLSARERARVIPGNPAGSELLRRIRGQARPRMPFDGPPYLDESEIELIESWIQQGARDATGEPGRIPVGADVRLHGILQGRWILDDLPLKVLPVTRIDKGPETGDYVEVRGKVEPEGSVAVVRIRAR